MIEEERFNTRAMMPQIDARVGSPLPAAIWSTDQAALIKLLRFDIVCRQACAASRPLILKCS